MNSHTDRAPRSPVSTLLQHKQLIFVYAFLLVMLVVANIASPGFLQLSHISNLLRQASFLGIVAIGQTLVILTGGIDLSVSYIITFTNILAADTIMGRDEQTLPALLLVLAVGLVIGIFNGVGVYYLKIPPMIMTLGVGTVVYGLSFIYSQGAPRGRTSPFIEFMANGKIGGVLNGSLLIWLILAFLLIFLLRNTAFGRNIYAIGVNRNAAYFSGLKVGRLTIGVYAVSGVMSGLAGLLLLGYTGTSYFSTGDPYAMDSVAAVVMGGTAVSGGKGGYVGTLAGVIIMTVISSLMTVLNMPEAGRMVVQGSIIIAILLLVYGRKG